MLVNMTANVWDPLQSLRTCAMLSSGLPWIRILLLVGIHRWTRRPTGVRRCHWYHIADEPPTGRRCVACYMSSSTSKLKSGGPLRDV
ncbi:hypothetical protein K523DRAFT_72536 [Schizophyllum commune Tattone D]|nr:hypothetical protein K523DRAFT_72536 [Schizophyllum commune Tattone D]